MEQRLTCMNVVKTAACLIFAGLATTAETAMPVIAFRGDSTGNFAGACPPSTFSADSNLAWKAEVGQGCGTAIVVGDRLWVQTAPNALICLDKATGKELWRRTHHAGTLAPSIPAAVFDAAMDDVGAYHVLAQKSRRLAKEDPTRIAWEAEMKTIEAKLPKDFGNQIPGSRLDGYYNGGLYLICTTPCSDGQRVIAVFPTGVAVAYDLDGKPCWSADIRPSIAPPPGFKGRWDNGRVRDYFSTPPVIAPGGVVIVLFGGHAIGLDAVTGATRWKSLLLCRGNPAHTRAAMVLGQVGSQTYVATGTGHILRTSDGQIVYEDSIGGSGVPAVVFAQGIFCWTSFAVRLSAGPEPKPEKIWDYAGPPPTLAKITNFGWKEQPRLGDGDMTSPIVVDGHLLLYNQSRMLVTLDLATGAELGERRSTKLQKKIKALSSGVTKNWAYGGMVRAEGTIVVAHDYGVVKMIPLDAKAGPVVENALPDDIYGQPICDGPALYIRSLNALLKFQAKTADKP